MVSQAEITALTNRFGEYLNSRADHLRAFEKYGSQLEGWLKGELIWFLDREKAEGRLANFDREVLMPQQKSRKRFDLRLAFSTSDEPAISWVELKHWLIGYQKDYQYNCQFYFGDASSVGIKPDVEKLREVRNGDKYLLILMTKNPGTNDWEDGIRKFNEKFRPLHLHPLTRPLDYPGFFFLALMKV